MTPLTQRDLLNPFSDFGLTLLLLVVIVSIVWMVLSLFWNHLQDWYENNDKDPFDAPRIT